MFLFLMIFNFLLLASFCHQLDLLRYIGTTTWDYYYSLSNIRHSFYHLHHGVYIWDDDIFNFYTRKHLDDHDYIIFLFLFLFLFYLDSCYIPPFALNCLFLLLYRHFLQRRILDDTIILACNNTALDTDSSSITAFFFYFFFFFQRVPRGTSIYKEIGGCIWHIMYRLEISSGKSKKKDNNNQELQNKSIKLFNTIKQNLSQDDSIVPLRILTSSVCLIFLLVPSFASSSLFLS